MELFYATELSVPLWQMVLMLALSTFALLYGRVKLALIINYLFTLSWGYLLNRNLFPLGSEQGDTFTIAYFSLGVLVAVLAAAGFFFQQD